MDTFKLYILQSDLYSHLYFLPEESTTPSSSHLCHVIGSGVFPALTVTDARCYGSALNISKKQLWHLFSLDEYVEI